MATSSIDQLLEKIPNRFNLVMVAAKRARQIKDGAPRLIPTDSVNPVTIALEEITAGKLVLQDGVIKLLDDFGRPLPAARPQSDDLLALLDEEEDDTGPSAEEILAGLAGIPGLSLETELEGGSDSLTDSDLSVDEDEQEAE